MREAGQAGGCGPEHAEDGIGERTKQGRADALFALVCGITKSTTQKNEAGEAGGGVAGGGSPLPP